MITLVVVFVVMIVLASMVANLEPELPAFMEDNGIQKTDPTTGSANPNVVIVFFGDFANETSASISTSLSTLLQEFPNEVLVAWKDFPNSTLNNESARAAIAARCAQNQDAFWPYYDFLMSHQYELGAELYTEIAKELELDVKKFTSCLENLDTLDLVESSANEGLELDL
ncbi:MAG: thioredoxin domain-containing protein, partial [Candidatus Uhrbacteria bacterium]|nr:thioredoxin domain-containing protein [Candidatus Uhrbacteria bacterium]